MAGISNASNYINAFRRNPDRSYPLENLLAEVWDFDSEIVQAQNGGPIAPGGKPFRAYWQFSETWKPTSLNSPKPYLIYLPSSCWLDYPGLHSPWNESPPVEVPPLPPSASNSHGKSDTKDGKGMLMFTHHLIRDFMFTDATYHNEPAEGDYSHYSPDSTQKYTVECQELILTDEVKPYTRGTGNHTVAKKYIVKLDNIHHEENLEFLLLEQEITYTAKYYQLISLDGTEVYDEDQAPNWFGVAVPKGCNDFSNVIIYFHPGTNSGNVDINLHDKDYPTRSGAPNRSDWKELFGYVDRLGTQLAAAIEKGATPNQIVIVPFMTDKLCNVTNNDGTIGDAGILPDQWYYIVNDIIQDLAKTMGGN